MALLLGLAAAGCDPQVSTEGKTVRVQEIAGGPVGGRVHLFAATSLPQLQGLVWATGSTPSYADCAAVQGNPQVQTACWWGAPAPAASLLLAAGLVSPNCDRPLAVTANLTGASTLVVSVDHGSTCHGASTGSSPLLSLLAIPLSDLPPLLLDVRLVHRGDPLSGAATEVDLRRPLDQPSDPIALAQRIREGYVNAAADAGSRLGLGGLVPASIAVRRWDDASAGCPSPGRKYDRKPVHGYAIRMVSATDPRHPVVEYHGDPAALVYCGVAATASPSPTPR